MGFSGFGLIFSDSTMFRMRLCVFRDNLEPLIFHPERPLLLLPLVDAFRSCWRISCDCSWSSASAWSTTSQLGVTATASGESGESLGLRLGQLARLRLLWNRNWLSLATLLGIITGPSKKKRIPKKPKKKIKQKFQIQRCLRSDSWQLEQSAQMNVKLVSCLSFQTSIRISVADRGSSMEVLRWRVFEGGGSSKWNRLNVWLGTIANSELNWSTSEISWGFYRLWRAPLSRCHIGSLYIYIWVWVWVWLWV